MPTSVAEFYRGNLQATFYPCYILTRQPLLGRYRLLTYISLDLRRKIFLHTLIRTHSDQQIKSTNGSLGLHPRNQYPYSLQAGISTYAHKKNLIPYCGVIRARATEIDCACMYAGRIDVTLAILSPFPRMNDWTFVFRRHNVSETREVIYLNSKRVWCPLSTRTWRRASSCLYCFGSGEL